MALTEVPISKGTFKIFIGRLNPNTTPKDLRALFEKYGTVAECDVVKNYGFVHMEDETSGLEAIRHLNNSNVNGSQIKVEASRSRKIPIGTTVKIFVGNLPPGTKPSEVRELFAPYGNVMECDLVHNYGFVHIETPDASKVLSDLNGFVLNGMQIKVQMSTSRARQRPGMGNPQQCYNVVTPTTAYGMVAPSVTTTAAVATYADPASISRSVYTYAARDVYQPPPPPTTAAYISRDRVYPYTVPPEMYDRYYDPTAAAAAAVAAAAATNVRYEDYSSAYAVRRDVVNRAALPTTTTTARTDYDVFNRHSPQPTATRYAAPDPHTTTAAVAAAVPTSAVYDEYGRMTAPPPPAPTGYEYLDARVGAAAYPTVGATTGIYDEYLASAALASAPAPPPPSMDAYDTERRDGLRSSTRYAPY